MLDGIVESLVGLFRDHWGLLLVPAVLFWRRRGAMGGTQAGPLHAPALPPDVVAAYNLSTAPEGAAAARDRVFPDQDPQRVERMFAEFGFSFARDGSFATHPGPRRSGGWSMPSSRRQTATRCWPSSNATGTNNPVAGCGWTSSR